MKAAVFERAGAPFSIVSLPDPAPGPDDVVIKVHRCGICGSDISMTSGSSWDFPCQSVLGHEYAGEVVLKGRNVGELEIGDRVTAMPTIGCGACLPCQQGTPILCGEMRGGSGAFAEYISAPARTVMRLPDGLGMTEGALVEPLAVGLRGTELAGIRAGDRVLVLGTGFIGAAAAYWARQFGAGKVAMASRSQAKLAVADLVEADGLVLLSDIDGMYTANPQKDAAAQFLPVIEKITPEIEAMAGGAASELSRGGMKTKVDAAKIATAAGCTMLIASGKIPHPLRAIEEGGKCTAFKAIDTPLLARKKWIAGSMSPSGAIVIDAGAASALANGKSLLPAGVKSIEGAFEKGDVVIIRDMAGVDIARGLVAYDAADATLVIGRKSDEIGGILGEPFRAEIVHRDDMVML